MLNIRSIPVSKIIPAKYNPRVELRPGDPQFDQLARGIDEFGLVEPLVWNSRTSHLVGGHQRLAILISRGATHVDVSVVDLPPDREKALNVALNRLSGRWDDHKLAALLEELVACPELDVTLTGFAMPEIHSLIGAESNPLSEEPDRFDAQAELEAHAHAEPITQPGDLITLGTDERYAHRLLCGDSTNPEHVRWLMQGERAALCCTDPPYLIGYLNDNRPGKAKRKKSEHADQPNWDDASQTDLFDKFLGTALAEALVDDVAIYTFYASKNHTMMEQAWLKHNLLIHQQVLWVKPNPVPGRCWYGYRHEPALFGWPKGKKPKRLVKDMLSTVWEVHPSGSGTSVRPQHLTPKPVRLFEIAMEQHTRTSNVGEAIGNVYEPFAGAGTQLIAAQRLRRRCFAMEINPHFCDIITRRFIAYAGEHAVSSEIAEKYRLPEPSVVGAPAPTTLEDAA